MARAVHTLVQPYCPHSVTALLQHLG